MAFLCGCTVQRALPEGGTAKVQGIVSRNQKTCVRDGMCVLEISSSAESFRIVYGEGRRNCLNQDIVDQGFIVKEGEEVEVLGKVTGKDSLDACGLAEAYIRRLKSTTP